MVPNLIAGIDLANGPPAATAPYFVLGVNAAGLWVIREAAGRKGGLFRLREEAIKYARGESLNGHFTIVYQPDGLELELHEFRRAA